MRYSTLTATGSTAAQIVPNSRAEDSVKSTFLAEPVSRTPPPRSPKSVSPGGNTHAIPICKALFIKVQYYNTAGPLRVKN